MNKKNKIEWFGIDGILVLSFFVICTIIFISLVNKIDFVIGYAVPAVALSIVTAIFIRYLFTVYHFMKITKTSPKKD